MSGEAGKWPQITGHRRPLFAALDTLILPYEPHHSKVFSEPHTHSFLAPNPLFHFCWVERFSKKHCQGGISNFLLPWGDLQMCFLVIGTP